MVRGCHAPADREDDPLRYRHGSGYVVTADIEDIYARWDDDTGPIEATEGFVQQLLEYAPSDEKQLQSAMSAARKTWRLMPRRSQRSMCCQTSACRLFPTLRPSVSRSRCW